MPVGQNMLRAVPALDGVGRNLSEFVPAYLMVLRPAAVKISMMSKPASIRRRPPQMSLGFMMLMMVIFSVMSAGLFYASRVPAVQEEINVLIKGETGGASEDLGRLAHITFIMFTFTSPLILAGVLSTGMAVLRWFHRRA